LTWPDAADLTETELEARLFPTEHVPITVRRPPPDCRYIYDELRRYRNVNLTLIELRLEYKGKHPDGYQYTQFCEYYHRWRGHLDYCMSLALCVHASDSLKPEVATGALRP